MRASAILKLVFLISVLMASMVEMGSQECAVQAKKKKKEQKPQFSGGNKAQMIFIMIREGYVPPEGIEKMAKDFQQMMSTGGLKVGIVGTEDRQMIAIANTIREMLEIRKFAVQVEAVLSVEYDKNRFPGNYIT